MYLLNEKLISLVSSVSTEFCIFIDIILLYIATKNIYKYRKY